jgi:hypothetical protein
MCGIFLHVSFADVESTPGWSRGLVTAEDPTLHRASKWLTANGTVIIVSVGLGEVVAARSAAGSLRGLGPRFGTWNEFQAGTAGQFSSRAEAAQAWQVYKDANGIVTGTTRSAAARSQYLRSLTEDYRTPSWMKPWLEEGKCPQGYNIDHIKPLSIGGPDTPANMRLQGTDLHRLWHKWYHPWLD